MLNGKVLSEACFSSTNPAESRCPGGASQSTALGSSNVCAVADCKHGTHVASTAAGRTVTEGAASISGVAKGAGLITISAFNKTTGAATSNIVLGLERVYALRSSFKIAAVNMSLQGGRYFSPQQCDAENQAYRQAIDNLRGVGIPSVVASGNSGWRDSMAAPACVSTAVSIGNTTKDDLIAASSNQAYWQTLMAPGTNILAAYPNSQYGQLSGTSMASPHVAGAWAILKQRTGGAASINQGITAFRSTAVPLQDVMGNWYARIRVDHGLSLFPTVSAIANQAVTPGAPADSPVTIGDAQQGPNGLGFHVLSTNVSLTPRYEVLGTGAQRTLRIFTTAGMQGTATITFIVSDGTYQSQSQFQVSVGAAGPPGPPTNLTASLSGGVLAVAWGAPTTGAAVSEYLLQIAFDAGFGNIVHTLSTAAPSGFVASLAGSTLTMTWQAPTSGGAPSEYVLEAALDPGFAQIVFAGGVGANRNLTFTGIPPGTFHLRVRARNASGISGPSNSQQIGGGGCAAPGTPASFTITKLGGLLIRLSWTPGGGATGHTLQAALDPSFATVIATVPVGPVSTLDVNAVPGTFFVRVSATNSCGASGPSNVASVTLP